MAKHIPIRQGVLDIETTGLDSASGDRIIEIAGVEILDSHVTGKHLHIYINPERDIDLGAVAIHGISLDMLLDKPKFSEVAKEITDFIRGAELILHNAPFDVDFLNMELSLVGLDPIEGLCPSELPIPFLLTASHSSRGRSLVLTKRSADLGLACGTLKAGVFMFIRSLKWETPSQPRIQLNWALRGFLPFQFFEPIRQPIECSGNLPLLLTFSSMPSSNILGNPAS